MAKLTDEKRIRNLLQVYELNLSTKGSYAKIRKHLKKKYKADASEQASTMIPKFGHVCALLDEHKKIKLPEDIQVFYDEKVSEILQKIKDNPPPVREKPKVKIQDRLREKADKCISELEEQFDDIMLSDFKDKPSPMATIVKHQFKPMHLRFIIKWADDESKEWIESLDSDDPQMKEAYGHFTITKRKKMIAYFNSVKECCEKIKSLTKKKSSVRIKIL